MSERSGRAVERTRGATAVEYALALSAVAVGILFAVQTVQDRAEAEFADRGSAIGHPSEVPVIVTTSSTTAPSTTSTTTSTTTPSYLGTMAGTCGNGLDKNLCTFTLSIDPAPTVTAWSILPNFGFTVESSTNTTFAVRFTASGTRSVFATVDTTELEEVIDCNSGLNCAPA